MKMPLLKIRNIESYYGPIMAIKGVSLDIAEGSIVTILGANGAGKTTILKTISGVLEPQKGTIEFMGERIEGISPAEIVRRGIVHVPEGREVFADLSVKENLMMGSYLRKDKAGIKEDLDVVCDYFPILSERTSQLAGYMSGGEQQMLAMARALMARPKLMLLDEPSLGLSPALMNDIYKIVKRINSEQKTTILLVEQNARMALSLAQFGYILDLGRFVMENTCKELMENEDVKEFYLGVKETSVRETKRWKRVKKWR
ncbi:MAG: ABC transporter ATP-binding protein [Deltaproteobacteria bacterium]|jgi:branched-chain amino acid transport system ATP-binding protein|nr:ABC transporter ATP-binding protein [Deltaproteobacteria bacterium]MBT4641141.1 ABC transporter ATP-binding protein [Deltaproteobacteria bacterium]MBT6504977.1 ABC transporter ATP-binding protein [Deltaproteobacteria bacterium]MBT6614001.1 ABC transporter ATP-binding protein [Deltaproteobacteria bacterium]MBT7153960.1 ABC transporter ATP-binding protein [Deltaproteobacteria bacterium]